MRIRITGKRLPKAQKLGQVGGSKYYYNGRVLDPNNQVDAAYLNKEDETFLFSGNQYYKYSTFDYEWVDEGYPKSITTNLSKPVKYFKQFQVDGCSKLIITPSLHFEYCTQKTIDKITKAVTKCIDSL